MGSPHSDPVPDIHARPVAQDKAPPAEMSEERPPRSRGGFIRLLATGFGAGRAPFAAGTVGSLWGPPLAGIVQYLAGPPETAGAIARALVIAAALFAAGVWICTRTAREFQARDPRSIVYDEYAAFPIVFLLVPLSWTSAIAGFVWFRVFDILKPWPIQRIERLPGGLGIMADDFVAAAYSAAALVVTMRVLAAFGIA